MGQTGRKKRLGTAAARRPNEPTTHAVIGKIVEPAQTRVAAGPDVDATLRPA
jgi:hypothetical protein